MGQEDLLCPRQRCFAQGRFVKLVSVLENSRRNHIENEENNNFEQNTKYETKRGPLKLFQFEIVGAK